MTNSDRVDDGQRLGSTTPLYRTTVDWSQVTPSAAAVDAVASVEAVDSLELAAALDHTLHDFVDPEALDTLLGDGSKSPRTIDFRYGPYRLRIEGDVLSVWSREG